MATTTYKVLGQSAPSATSNTDLYTVPASTQAIISSLVVCNRSASSVTYRIAIRPAGATLANQHWIVYDATLLAHCSETITLGIGLAETDVITVFASTANTSFSAFGAEIT